MSQDLTTKEVIAMSVAVTYDQRGRNHMSEAGGRVTAPWPDIGEGSADTPRIHAPRSQQNDSTLFRARM